MKIRNMRTYYIHIYVTHDIQMTQVRTQINTEHHTYHTYPHDVVASVAVRGDGGGGEGAQGEGEGPDGHGELPLQEEVQRPRARSQHEGDRQGRVCRLIHPFIHPSMPSTHDRPGEHDKDGTGQNRTGQDNPRPIDRGGGAQQAEEVPRM